MRKRRASQHWNRKGRPEKELCDYVEIFVRKIK